MTDDRKRQENFFLEILYYTDGSTNNYEVVNGDDDVEEVAAVKNGVETVYKGNYLTSIVRVSKGSVPHYLWTVTFFSWD